MALLPNNFQLCVRRQIFIQIIPSLHHLLKHIHLLKSFRLLMRVVVYKILKFNIGIIDHIALSDTLEKCYSYTSWWAGPIL